MEKVVEETNHAIYEAIRTRAVLQGGILGSSDGQVGMALGGITAGFATDCVASFLTDKPQGIIAVIDKVFNDIKNDKNPTKSILDGAAIVYNDGACAQSVAALKNTTSALTELELEPFMTKFLEIFDVKSLDDIRIRLKGVANYRYLFRGLTKTDKQALKKLIRDLNSAGYLNAVIEIVVTILSDMYHVTFISFIRVSQFVGTFVAEKVSESFDMEDFYCYFIRHSNTPMVRDMITLRGKCSATWKDLLNEISRIWIKPYFRDDFSAAYHYYKHRRISWMNIELPVEEYFDLIESMLEKLKITEQYAELGFARTTAIHIEYYGNYDGTVKIGVKIQQGKIVLSCCSIINGYLLPPEDNKFGD